MPADDPSFPDRWLWIFRSLWLGIGPWRLIGGCSCLKGAAYCAFLFSHIGLVALAACLRNIVQSSLSFLLALTRILEPLVHSFSDQNESHQPTY